jgi:hypothetical protein
MAAVAAGAALVLGAQWAARGDRPNDDTAGRAPAVTQARDATGEGSDGAFETDSARGFESEADASASIGVL